MDIFLESRFDQISFDAEVDAQRQRSVISKSQAPVEKNRLQMEEALKDQGESGRQSLEVR